MNACPHCGMIHQTTCPRIKAIEYNPDGTTRRVEFHEPLPVVTGPPSPLLFNPNISHTFGHQASGLSNACEQDEGA